MTIRTDHPVPNAEPGRHAAGTPIPERLSRAWTTFVEEEGEMGVPREAFVSRCLTTIDERAQDDETRREAVYQRLVQGDIYLAIGCLAGHRRALRRFLDRFGEYLRVLSVKHTSTLTMADDVEAEMLSTLFTARRGADMKTARLQSYRGLGPLQGWLRVTTHRVAIDFLRRVRRHSGEDVLVNLSDSGPGVDSELASLDAARRLQPIFSSCIQALGEEEQLLLRLYYRDNQVLREIGIALGIKTTSAFRRLEKARASVWRVFKARARAELNLGERDLKSLLTSIAANLRLDDLFVVAAFLMGLIELAPIAC